MKRVFWLGVGAAAGIYVLRKATRTAEALSPTGISASISGLGDVVREFVADVKTAMAEHEQELLEALGVDADGTVNEAAAGPRPTHAGRRR